MECLTPTVSFNLITNNYFISSRIFASLPTSELTIFKQEVCSTKLGYENTLLWGSNSCKKDRDHFEQRSTHQANTLFNLCGWLERQQGVL